MPTYTVNEASWEIPTGWRDRTVNIFSYGTEPPLPLSLVVSRDELKSGQTLADFADEQVKQFGEKLHQFRLLGKRQLTVSGAVALEAEFTWRSEKGPMHQRQVYVPTAGSSKLVIMTATAPVKIADDDQEKLNALLESFQFR
jgi:hypothetical protein